MKQYLYTRYFTKEWIEIFLLNALTFATRMVNLCTMEKKTWLAFFYFSMYHLLYWNVSSPLLIQWFCLCGSLSFNVFMCERKHELHAVDVSAHRNHCDEALYKNVSLIEHRFLISCSIISTFSLFTTLIISTQYECCHFWNEMYCLCYSVNLWLLVIHSINKKAKELRCCYHRSRYMKVILHLHKQHPSLITL